MSTATPSVMSLMVDVVTEKRPLTTIQEGNISVVSSVPKSSKRLENLQKTLNVLEKEVAALQEMGENLEKRLNTFRQESSSFTSAMDDLHLKIDVLCISLKSKSST
ncbi:uncharacterized protein LOC122243306 [Penaeus japonicus]|uniref:uncharacterized protein LOC122243306 n=1 Tax=Penaeus japonicus TaxID=27405 RepID=UPI001C71382D|nr:uncharacterized protein LOC122243306 [Penaeus japonicus]